MTDMQQLSADDRNQVLELLRRKPSDVRDKEPVRYRVRVVEIRRGTVPRRFGEVLAQVEVSNVDPDKGREAASRHQKAFATQRRVRDGRAAVTVIRPVPGGAR